MPRDPAGDSERLAELARRTSNAVIITDRQGLIEWVNEGFTRITEYVLDEVIGKKPGDFLQCPASGRDEKARMAAAVRDGEGVKAEILNVSKSGRAYMLAIEITPLHAADGEVNGFMAIESDVTAQRRATDILREAQERAEAASHSKSEFLANMSHEIRTPLTAILGFAEVLREDVKRRSPLADQIEAIDTINDAAMHLLTVINDILDLSKIEADRMTVEQIDTSLPDVLRGVEQLMRLRAVGKGVTLAFDVATPVAEHVVSDPTRLRQILVNLVGNAVKFTEAGAVTVRVQSVDGSLRIDVEDTGPGMTSAQADRLFTAFGQADGTVTRKHGGTGLGLTICRRLAGLMGGKVTLVRSVPGSGSCFRLELPLTPIMGSATFERLDAVPPSGRAEVAVATKLDGRVLLAEDGVMNQKLVAAALRKAGATVGIADNGVIALAMLDEAAAAGVPYDLLLTDMQMPEMDGYTLATTLRGRGSRMPIVALTAHAMAEDREKCRAAGCDDYSPKPFQRAALIATCASWLGRKAGVTAPPRDPPPA